MRARFLLIALAVAFSSCSVHHNVILQRRCGGSISMPVVEMRPRNESGDAFLVLMTGDGGWRAIDKGVADEFAAHGVPTVGMMSHIYFANGHSADDVACDVDSLIEHYAAAWRKNRVVLVGYSRGADAIPFIVKRLPPELQSRVILAAMLAPARQAEFLYHPFWNLSQIPAQYKHPTAPELANGSNVKLLCIHGTTEKNSLCPQLPRSVATSIAIAGGHHFDYDFKALGERIYRASGL